jgi:V/A-type H+-transporting ATPase subunit F
MKNIAVIGSSDSVRGFAALGLSVFEADTAESAAEIIKKITKSDYSVIYVTEVLYKDLTAVTAKFDDDPEIAIIPIPGTFGNNGIGKSEVSRSVERAVGSDILSNE